MVITHPCCNVYWLIDEPCEERLPAINLSHVEARNAQNSI
jgi:hypothetical protein